MNRALYAAATGMAARQQNLDIVTDNLANADVAGFKSAAATFESIGGDGLLGTAQSGVRHLFGQGKLMKSGGPFDVAIQGAGFFIVERDGVRAYTRAGAFSRAADGRLSNADGWKLLGVQIPSQAQNVTVGADGLVTVDLPFRGKLRAGRVALANFDAPEALRSIGSALFTETKASGRAQRLIAGGERGPQIAFGMLEKSNVSIVESMMAILAAQRAYEANAKGVQAADEMLRIANNLHRS